MLENVEGVVVVALGQVARIALEGDEHSVVRHGRELVDSALAVRAAVRLAAVRTNADARGFARCEVVDEVIPLVVCVVGHEVRRRAHEAHDRPVAGDDRHRAEAVPDDSVRVAAAQLDLTRQHVLHVDVPVVVRVFRNERVARLKAHKAAVGADRRLARLLVRLRSVGVSTDQLHGLAPGRGRPHCRDDRRHRSDRHWIPVHVPVSPSSRCSSGPAIARARRRRRRGMNGVESRSLPDLEPRF